MTQEELTGLIAAVLNRAPQWVRHDLATTDPSLRERAEETLAAMVAAGIAESVSGLSH
ncbi:hypothetical protein BH10PSE12_BH10PSE12_26150 [soil metagenome]